MVATGFLAPPTRNARNPTAQVIGSGRQTSTTMAGTREGLVRAPTPAGNSTSCARSSVANFVGHWGRHTRFWPLADRFVAGLLGRRRAWMHRNRVADIDRHQVGAEFNTPA